jgi:hypothetical protein
VLLNRSLTHYAMLYIILTAAISLGYYAIVLIKEPGLRETLYGLLPARPPQAG